MATSDDLKRAFEIEKEMKQQQARDNEYLRTKEMREKDRLRKLSKYKKGLLRCNAHIVEVKLVLYNFRYAVKIISPFIHSFRIRFPDRTELQGTFGALETMEAVYAFVQVPLLHYLHRLVIAYSIFRNPSVLPHRALCRIFISSQRRP